MWSTPEDRKKAERLTPARAKRTEELNEAWTEGYAQAMIDVAKKLGMPMITAQATNDPAWRSSLRGDFRAWYLRRHA